MKPKMKQASAMPKAGVPRRPMATRRPAAPLQAMAMPGPAPMRKPKGR